jgi:hypothetical protein
LNLGVVEAAVRHAAEASLLTETIARDARTAGDISPMAHRTTPRGTHSDTFVQWCCVEVFGVIVLSTAGGEIHDDT